MQDDRHAVEHHYARCAAKWSAATLVDRIMLLGIIWIIWGWKAGLFTIFVTYWATQSIAKTVYENTLEELEQARRGQ